MNIESAIINALLVNQLLWEKVDFLIPDYFKLHKSTFELIYPKLVNGEEINILLFSNELRSKNISFQIAPNVDKQWIQEYATKLKDEFVAGKLNQLSFDVKSIEDKDNDYRISFIEGAVKEIETIGTSGIDTKVDTYQKAITFLDNDNHMIPSPWEDWNNKIGGWFEKQLVIWGGEPGTGKTTYMRQAALHSARMGIPTAIFTLETSKELQLIYFACSELKIYAPDVFKNEINNEQKELIRLKLLEYNDIPLYLMDTTDCNNDTYKISLQTMRLYRKYKIRICFIDYLQAIGGEPEEYKTIGVTIRSLERIVNTTQMTICLFSQFSRALNTRGGSKRPQKSDFKGNSAIEQSGDLLIGQYRPETHGILEDEEGNKLKGITELIVLKNKYTAVLPTLVHKYNTDTGDNHPTNDDFVFDEEEPIL